MSTIEATSGNKNSGSRCTIWTDVVRCVYLLEGRTHVQQFSASLPGTVVAVGIFGKARESGAPRKERRCRTERAIERHRQGMGGSGKVSPASLHHLFVQPKHVSENLECMSVTDKRVIYHQTPSKH